MTRYTRIRDFHASRARGIGSSDIPTLAGFNKQYGQTPYTLYLEKIGEGEKREAGPRAEWGHRLEPLVLSAYLSRHYDEKTALDYLAAAIRKRSLGPFKSLTECRMRERPYVLAHADLVVDDGADPYIVEAKTTGYFAGKRREGEAFLGYDPDDLSQQGIPDPVFLQVQWQMLAYDIKTAFVAVLIDTGDYREYGPIVADPRTQEKCLAKAEELWNCVLARTPPMPETWSDVASMWPVPDEKTAMIGGEIEMKARDWIDRYHRSGKAIEAHDARRKNIKNALGILIGENSILSTPSGVKLASSWIQANPASVDLKGLKEKDDELYGRLVAGGYVRTSERRELRPAKVKGDL